MSRRLPWFKLWAADWSDDARLLSIEARAVRIDLMAAIWRHGHRGTYRLAKSTWATLLGVPEPSLVRAIAELVKRGHLEAKTVDGELALHCRDLSDEYDKRKGVADDKAERRADERAASPSEHDPNRAQHRPKAGASAPLDDGSLSDETDSNRPTEHGTVVQGEEEEEVEEDAVPDGSSEKPSASCAEPSAAAEAPAPTPCPELAEFPEWQDDPRFIARFLAFLETAKRAYPGIDVIAELRKARMWEISNPTRKKTPRGRTRFLNSWLSRAQDAGGPIRSSPNNGSKPPVDMRAIPEGGKRLPPNYDVKAMLPGGLAPVVIARIGRFGGYSHTGADGIGRVFDYIGPTEADSREVWRQPTDWSKPGATPPISPERVLPASDEVKSEDAP